MFDTFFKHALDRDLNESFENFSHSMKYWTTTVVNYVHQQNTPMQRQSCFGKVVKLTKAHETHLLFFKQGKTDQ